MCEFGRSVRLISLPLLTVLHLLFPASGAAQDAPVNNNNIVIGTIGGQLDLANSDTYQPFSIYLDQSLPGRQFQVLPYDSIESLIAAVDRDELEFAMITPAAYVELAARHEVRTIATVTQQLGDEVYPWLAGAVFALSENADIETLADARGKRVIALSQLALGGWLSAVREWKVLGIDVTRNFSKLDFVFSYAQVLEQVCNGTADVGVISAGIFNRMRNSCSKPMRVLGNPGMERDPRYPTEVSTRLYPEVAFVVIGKTVEERMVMNLTQALLSIEPGSDVAAAATVAGFTAPLSYEPVVELMQELRLGPYENFGRFTFAEFLLQHGMKVLAVLLLFLGFLIFAFTRSQLLNGKLKQSEKYRRLLFEKSSFPVVVTDRKTLRFIDLNPAALHAFGYTDLAQLLGKTPLAVSSPTQKNGRDSNEILLNIEKLILENASGIFDWTYQRPDGSTWEAEVHMLPLNFGELELLQTTLIDVTERNRIRDERERMEHQLQHAQRLESLGRLSGAIAHDFNNLLTVINGYSELLLLNMDKTAAGYRTVMEIAQAGWRARELTNQLLTFGRRQIASMQPMDVNAMILESGNMFRSLLGEKNQLQTSLETDIGLTLADTGQLNQVLMNMLVNAKDAMPEGGYCYITTDKKSVFASEASALGLEEGEYVVISVTDTGAGMSVETQEHIFEPFFSTKGDKGTGIGLATAYGIIKQCGGTITFLSETGVGTTFTLYLPVTMEERHARAGSDRLDTDLKASKPFTILVVEDQPDVRLYACSVLRSAGYKVLEAESGYKALELTQARQGRIDMLFTDVVMPGMNGRELAERFEESWSVTKILFTSGYADDEVALHGVVQEKIKFIAKPYIPQHLLLKVKGILG